MQERQVSLPVSHPLASLPLHPSLPAQAGVRVPRRGGMRHVRSGRRPIIKLSAEGAPEEGR
eukprot:364884-Chlamydomonas_euryale.AAC.7